MLGSARIPVSFIWLFSAFFHLYAVPGGEEALITRSALRSLLTDLNQVMALLYCYTTDLVGVF